MNISLQEILTQAVAFALLVWVLRKFAWKPLLALLEERRERIRKGFEDAETVRQEVEQLKLKYDNAIQKIEQEAREKTQQAIQEGKKISREIEDDARQRAREILDKAKEDIGIEIAKARLTLRNDLANLTLSATEKVLQKKIDDARDQELILDIIQQLEASQ